MSSVTPTIQKPTPPSDSGSSIAIRSRGSYVLLAGTVLSLAGMLGIGLAQQDGARRLGHAWLLNGWFVLTICLGAVFFVAIQHLTRAGWSVSVRRVAEMIGSGVAVPVALLVPVILTLLFGYSGIYPWNDATSVAGDSVLLGKQAYLNAPFFTLRTVLYGATWIAVAAWLAQTSRRQDISGDKRLTLLMERRSAPLLIVLGLTLTFAAFDWLMSLDPYWFSTIFGVYVFSGAMVASLALLSLIAAISVQTNALPRFVNREHLHDVVKLLFGFNCFWAYIAFSQYLLTWYANIPEETVWYKHRQTAGWELVSLALIVGHFVLPFLVLMPRSAKRNPMVVIAMSALLLVMHWVDMYWLIYPQLTDEPVVGAIELLGAVFFVGVTVLGVLWFAQRDAIVPIRDPRLREAVKHTVT